MVAYQGRGLIDLLIFISCRLEAVLSKTVRQAYGGADYATLKRPFSYV